jgi:hypothetical protein
MEKSSNQKSFHYFFNILGSRVNISIKFFLQVHFKVLAVSTTTAVLVAKLAACVIDTGGKFATVVVDTGDAPWLANISKNNFLKFLNDPCVIFRGLGEDDWRKKPKQKISWLYAFQPCNYSTALRRPCPVI